MTVSKVANGQPTDAGQFNGLVDEVSDPTLGHAHNGAAGGGKKVSHGNLTDGAIGAGKTHAQIDAHIGSTPGSGSAGVHGIHGSAYVMGIKGGQPCFQAGSATVPAGGSVVVATNLSTVQGVSITPGPGYNTSFPHGGGSNYFDDSFWWVDSLTDGNFTIHSWSGLLLSGSCTFFWLAWGVP